MKKLISIKLSILALTGTLVNGQDSPPPATTRLTELTVTADGPAEVRESDAGTVAELIDDLPLIVVNLQGAGAQSDLQIRGASFSESGLSVGPLALRNPQTEHFNANLPLSTLIFESAKVLTGLDSGLNGASHLAGTVRLNLAPVTSRGMFEIGAAENGEFSTSAFIEEPLGRWGETAIGASVFASWSDLSRGLDYPDNTLQTDAVGARLQFLNAWSQTDILLGRETREFGARGFYGVTPTLAAFERTRDSLAMAVGQALSETLGDVEYAIAWRKFEDEYALPEIDYLNEHRSTTVSAALAGITPISKTDRIDLNWNVSAESEKLVSDNLGDQARRSAAIALVPQLGLGNEITLSLGGETRVFSHESPWIGTLGGIAWTAAQGVEFYIDYVESVRQPSYTELNYESPASLGNSGLNHELSREWTGGVRWYNSARTLTAQLAAFQRDTSETIDWVKEDVDDSWQAENIGDVRTTGVELTGGWIPHPKFQLELAYTWLEKEVETEAAIGRYILDHPRHELALALDWKITDWIELKTDTTLRHQTESDMRTSDRTGVMLDAELEFSPDCLRGGYLTVFCDNALDDDFEPIAGQRPTPRRFGLSYTQAW